MSVNLEIESVISQQETISSLTNGVKSYPISVIAYDKMIEHEILDKISLPSIKAVVAKQEIKILVFNPEMKEIIRWIK